MEDSENTFTLKLQLYTPLDLNPIQLPGLDLENMHRTKLKDSMEF